MLAMQKSNGIKIRKLPLPLEIRLGSNAEVFDGLFRLTEKEADIIKIISVDKDDYGTYATCEIYPPREIAKQSRKLTDFSNDTLLGTDLSKSRVLGKEYGRYTYFKRHDGSFYVCIEGGSRTRRLQLGNLRERNTPIAVVARTIKTNFYKNEFSKKKITPFLPKQLSYGQILKATLDVLTLEGYIQKTQGTTRGRLRETFNATDKINEIIVTPEQA
jgi:hypothetical protein